MKVHLKKILLFPIILFFLPAFAIYVPFLKRCYCLCNIMVSLILLLILILDFNGFCNKVYDVYKRTPLKYLFYFVIYGILSSIIISIPNPQYIINTSNFIIVRFLLWIIPFFLYYIYIIETHISLKDLVRILICGFWIVLNLGFISWICRYYDIVFVNEIFNFLANLRPLIHLHAQYESFQAASNYFAFGLPRLSHLFEEPSYYAQILFLFLPFVYSFSRSPFRLFKNKIFNILVKKTLIPFTWANLVLTFSPIFLIFSTIITIIYFYKYLFKILKRYSILLLSLSFILLYIVKFIDFSDTFISRIINVLLNIKSFEDFIIVEPSLATRILSFINSLCVFLKNSIFGVGFGNLSFAIKEQFLNSPLPLTFELSYKLTEAFLTNYRMTYNSSMFYVILAENGLIGFSIIVYFSYKLFKLVKKYSQTNNIFSQSFSKALIVSLIGLLIMSFYQFSYTRNECFLILILAITYIYSKSLNLYNSNKTKGDNIIENTHNK